MTREESVAALRGLANALEREWATVDHMVETLRGLVENCPWRYDAGGTPAFWHHMRAAQRLVDALGKELRRER